MSEAAKKEKQVIIDEIKEKLEKSCSAVVIDYIGTTVEEANAMRKKLREAEVDYKVYKNTMITRAIEGTDFEQLKDVLAGPSAIAFSYDDSTAPARVLNGVMKEYKKMEFKAGYIDGTFYDLEGLKEIAAVPSREELLAKFLGSIQSPVSKFVRTLQAIADDKPADGAEAAPTAEKPAEETATATPVEEKPAAEAAAPVEEKPAEEPAKEEAAAPAEEAAPEAPAEDAEKPKE